MLHRTELTTFKEKSVMYIVLWVGIT